MKITNPIFLQSASNIKRGSEFFITLISTKNNPSIDITSLGEFSVETTYNGEKKVTKYSKIEETQVYIQSDANTEIVLSGEFEFLGLNYQNTGFVSANTSHNPSIKVINLSDSSVGEIDLSKNVNLEEFVYMRSANIEGIDLSSCVNLKMLFLENNLFHMLDVSKCSLLEEVSLTGCTDIETLKCVANNSDVATAIADAITNADSPEGTVYVASTDTYYSTIADATTEKGWTIEEPQA